MLKFGDYESIKLRDNYEKEMEREIGLYEVVVQYTGYRTFDVEANSEKEAEDIALHDAEWNEPSDYETEVTDTYCKLEPVEEEEEDREKRLKEERDRRNQISLF
jgi:hypothetical protein